ncbi:Tubby C-terminal-like domain [Phytophthora cinnamomi]|uniref:Tubby C-terminal-like domain n=2 Tax=Phytophthora cinnamomi TaxID=4785 RepID=UPI003559AFE1|nr:Tubby C-terminal-like domain [Phytophthora cinnamomi]
MGCASSSAIPKLPEAQQLAPVEAELCAQAMTTLRLRDRFWDFASGEDFVICDAEWGQDVFRMQPTTSAMKTLRDPRRKPLVHIKRELVAPVPTYNVYDAKASAAKLFSIKALPELNVEFQGPTTGEKCRIGLTGSWAKRQASIWMEHGRKGSRTTIGRVFRPSSSRSSVGTTRSSFLSSGQPDDEYFLAIMGGVDMALMVLICIALEQAHSEEW